MEEPDMSEKTSSDEMGAGGKASFLALGGAIMMVFGVVLTPALGGIGFFFVALGGFFVLASPIIYILLWWEKRSDE